MSDYGNYSSDDGSCDEIGLPKTPGAPLNANRSDSEKEQDSNRNDNSDVASNSGQSDDDEVNRSDEPNEVESDDSSDRKSINSRDESEAEQKSIESDSDKSDRSSSPIDNRRNEVSEDDDDGHSNVNRKRHSSSSEEANEEEMRKASKKRKTVIHSSSDDDDDDDDSGGEKMNKPNTEEDLFGELSDEDEDDQQPNRLHTDEKSMANLDDDDEDDPNRDESEIDANINEIFGGGDDDERANNSMDEEQDAPIPDTRIEVEIPRITANLGDSIHFVKLPNFLSIDTHPYDPQWYEDEIDEDEVHDDEGRARLKLKVENTIRWRNVTDENGEIESRESNARIVQWSDGSMSLHLGDEIFDIQTLNLLAGENNHLYIRQGTGLQGQSVFKTKLTFRPFSTESVTHRKLTMSLADRSQKTQKICVLPNVGKDPEAHRSEMIKKEEVKLKASIRKENKTKRVKDRGYTRGLSNAYLDHDDEDDESTSINMIKNQYKQGANYPYVQNSEDEEESDEDDSEPVSLCFVLFHPSINSFI
ncbi:RNA polymerase-associated protein LEO1-like protein [Euroglyphus maynei]|uniref:RNA polymerase-associated protein LEO1-like protein n=1 Tax=Euroglyphus maynei TaxID=6958 RepID=A0A1Y3AUE9_EURMA|nr:RNA polymerase-associated protein LEO1-like protein [Euroglyphus maynei]